MGAVPNAVNRPPSFDIAEFTRVAYAIAHARIQETILLVEVQAIPDLMFVVDRAATTGISLTTPAPCPWRWRLKRSSERI